MIQGIKKVCQSGLQIHCHVQSRYSSTAKAEWRKRKNLIFDQELNRQKDEVGRIEKIIVNYHPIYEEEKVIELNMNKDLSTPHDCTRHMSESVINTAAIAMVDGVPWDMHKPLTNDCEMKVLTMQMANESQVVNKSFWRTCCLILGSMIDSVFKDDITLYHHSFPWPNIKSGSFVYDIVLDLPDWKPTTAEMQALSAEFVKITRSALPVERLVVKEELALDIFEDNPFKSKQIPDIAKSSEGKLVLYRIGEFIDISKGPMVGNTNIVGRATVASVHKIEHDETDNMYRFQGVAIPSGIFLNHFAYGILEDRAKKLNETMWMPNKFNEDIVETVAVASN